MLTWPAPIVATRFVGAAGGETRGIALQEEPENPVAVGEIVNLVSGRSPFSPPVLGSPSLSTISGAFPSNRTINNPVRFSPLRFVVVSSAVSSIVRTELGIVMDEMFKN
jgi:hypothetical protein